MAAIFNIGYVLNEIYARDPHDLNTNYLEFLEKQLHMVDKDPKDLSLEREFIVELIKLEKLRGELSKIGNASNSEIERLKEKIEIERNFMFNVKVDEVHKGRLYYEILVEQDKQLKELAKHLTHRVPKNNAAPNSTTRRTSRGPVAPRRPGMPRSPRAPKPRASDWVDTINEQGLNKTQIRALENKQLKQVMALSLSENSKRAAAPNNTTRHTSIAASNTQTVEDVIEEAIGLLRSRAAGGEYGQRLSFLDNMNHLKKKVPSTFDNDVESQFLNHLVEIEKTRDRLLRLSPLLNVATNSNKLPHGTVSIMERIKHNSEVPSIRVEPGIKNHNVAKYKEVLATEHKKLKEFAKSIIYKYEQISNMAQNTNKPTRRRLVPRRATRTVRSRRPSEWKVNRTGNNGLEL